MPSAAVRDEGALQMRPAPCRYLSALRAGNALHPPTKKSPSGWPEGDFLTISRFYFANVSMNRIRIMAVSARLAVAFGFSLLLLPFSRPEPTAQRMASAA